MLSGSGARCVFCGQPIAEGDATVGRGSAIAHAACADRALTDDAHWDRIAEQSGEAAAPDEPPTPEVESGRRAGRAGCTILVAVAALASATGALLTALA